MSMRLLVVPEMSTPVFFLGKIVDDGNSQIDMDVYYGTPTLAGY